jgi:hypothetical protein
MNTISMTVTMTKATLKPRLQLRQVNELLADGTHSVFYGARPVLVGNPPRAPKAKAVAKPAWASPLSERFTAKMLCSLLVLSAIAGTAWGCLNVLERVQNWPVLNAWVGRVLGA